MKDEKNTNVAVDEAELDAALNEAEKDDGREYTHTMSRPFSYEGKEYDTLTFDWYKLTGRDSQAIEEELAALGKALVIPEFSGPYLVKMAARACTTKIGSDVIEAMPLPDYNKIRNKARAFLLRSGQ